MGNTMNTLISDEARSELARKAEAIYNAQLKALLEPAHNNEYVAIHVGTGDHSLGSTYRDAAKTLQSRHAKDGLIVGWKIGPEPDTDFLARMAAAEAGQFGRRTAKE
jgi:hypothetical protein